MDRKSAKSIYEIFTAHSARTNTSSKAETAGGPNREILKITFSSEESTFEISLCLESDCHSNSFHFYAFFFE